MTYKNVCMLIPITSLLQSGGHYSHIHNATGVILLCLGKVTLVLGHHTPQVNVHVGRAWAEARFGRAVQRGAWATL